MNIVDRMDGLSTFLEKARNMPLEEKIDFFKKLILDPSTGCYDYVMGINDDAIIQYIEHISKNPDPAANMDVVVNIFKSILTRFQNIFPGLQTDITVYLLPSLNLFKGMAIPTGESVVLRLGIDSLGELTEKQIKGYITHELFHVYHYQVSPGVRKGTETALKTMKMPALWALLWVEGVASHAVRILYPDIEEDEILDWRPLAEQTKPLLPSLAKEARRVLRSDLPQDIAGFFYFPRSGNANIPTGCGYYIGMLIVKTLEKRQSIHELISLDDEELVKRIDQVLTELQTLD